MLASIQPRTSLSKFARSPCTDVIIIIIIITDVLLVLAVCSCVLGYTQESWQFFHVSSLCNVRRDVNRCALLVLRPSWKPFSCRLFSIRDPVRIIIIIMLAFCDFSFGPDINRILIGLFLVFSIAGCYSFFFGFVGHSSRRLVLVYSCRFLA